MADVVVRVRTQSLGCDEVKGSQFKSVPGSGFTVHLDGAETVPGVLDEGAELYGECVYSGIVSVRYSRGETYSVELDVAGLDPGEVLVLPVVFYGSDMVPPPANVSYEAEVLLID